MIVADVGGECLAIRWLVRYRMSANIIGLRAGCPQAAGFFIMAVQWCFSIIGNVPSSRRVLVLGLGIIEHGSEVLVDYGLSPTVLAWCDPRWCREAPGLDLAPQSDAAERDLPQDLIGANDALRCGGKILCYGIVPGRKRSVRHDLSFR
jgi:hypothetical protein